MEKITKHSNAFTLIELMIAFVIIGILAIVAVPSYRKYVERVRVAEAYQTLGIMADNQKAYFYENKFFAPTPWNPGNTLTSAWTLNGWQAVGIPVAIGSRTFFKYSASAGINAEQGSEGSLTSGWTLNHALNVFNSTGTGGQNDEKNSCTDTAGLNPSSIEVGGRTNLIFTPSFFGVELPSAGDLNWAVLLAQGNLNKATAICKYISLTMTVAPAVGIDSPAMSHGFLEFDVDYDLGQEIGGGGAEEEIIEE